MLKFIETEKLQNEAIFNKTTIVKLGTVYDTVQEDTSYLFATNDVNRHTLAYINKETDSIARITFCKKHLYTNDIIEGLQFHGVYDMFESFVFLNVNRCRNNPGAGWLEYTGPEISTVIPLWKITENLKKELGYDQN